jgi:hypothetical protein
MKQFLLFGTLLFVLGTSGQTTYKKHSIQSEKLQVIDPKQSQDDYQAQLYNMEAPSPDGESYRSFIMRQKREVAKRYPRKTAQPNPQKTSAVQPAVNRGIRMTRQVGSQTVDMIGGVPNDNTLAVSNDGLVLAGINSLVWAYDINRDTTHFEYQYKGLRTIGGGSSSDDNFDPKLIYDPDADRWILVYLQNNTPANSRIKVCFSTTNDPDDPWNSYVLPGNPLNNNRWTDFPAITITDDELFITVNLIIPNVSWQVGFDGSVIWQVDKKAGYAGDTVLTNTLWSDIRSGGKYIRNLHPVWGATGNAPEAFFLSNRNFDLSNDSIFVLHLSGTIDDPNATLDIKVAQSNPAYGVPPNGRQEDTDPDDPTKGLQTNDARVLGAITNGTWIQYVSNTVVPSTGYAGIYHGFMTDIFNDPKIKGTIISHPTRDYGYPNLAYTGDEDCDIETMIGFNYTSPTDYAGVGVLYFGNDTSYSNPIDLKAGENYANRHSDSYERWGDYFGAQRKFNEPKKVWLAGYFANQNSQNVSWLSEVSSLDSAKLLVDVMQDGSALFCDASITVSAAGGVAPFGYSFNGGPFGAENKLAGICEGDTIAIAVQDARGCSFVDTLITEKTVAPQQPAAFPNPFQDRMMVQFKLPQEQQLTASIFDETGKLVEVILDQPAQVGENELLFSLQPLRQGIYILRIEGDKGFKYTEKIFKL